MQLNQFFQNTTETPSSFLHPITITTYSLRPKRLLPQSFLADIYCFTSSAFITKHYSLVLSCVEVHINRFTNSFMSTSSVQCYASGFLLDRCVQVGLFSLLENLNMPQFMSTLSWWWTSGLFVIFSCCYLYVGRNACPHMSVEHICSNGHLGHKICAPSPFIWFKNLLPKVVL